MLMAGDGAGLDPRRLLLGFDADDPAEFHDKNGFVLLLQMHCYASVSMPPYCHSKPIPD